MIRPANPLMHRARQWLGVALREWPHYRKVLARPDDDYLAICNRGQLLERATNGSGYRCVWQWTSDLHAPKFFTGQQGARVECVVIEQYDEPRIKKLLPVGASRPYAAANTRHALLPLAGNKHWRAQMQRTTRYAA